MAWLVGLTAAVLSVTSYIITDRLGAVLLSKDSISHLEIARRILDSSSPGLGQLGAVWLPSSASSYTALCMGQHAVLQRPGRQNPILDRICGDVVLMYRFVQGLTGRKLAGIVAAAVLP